METKLVAYVDGELSDREARSVAESVARDPEAQALIAELRLSKSFLAANEPDLKVPESREFYWGKIERAIARVEQAAEAPARPNRWFAWRRWLAPMAGFALVTFLSVAVINDYDLSLFNGRSRQLGEVENHSEHTSSFSFRSHAEKMFVVWVYDKADETTADTEPEPDDDDTVPK